MFNPKITPGPWKWKRIKEFQNDECDFVNGDLPKLINNDEFLICDFGNERTYATEGNPPCIEDAKALTALPELLEVYKAAVGVLAAKSEDEDTKRISYLADAVNTLEERHCERN